MKTTMRKNGIMMFDISVKFRIGRYHLISVVAEKISGNDPDPFSFSRAAIIELARLNAWHYGQTLAYGGEEDTSTSKTRGAFKRATQIVDKRFPELFTEKS